MEAESIKMKKNDVRRTIPEMKKLVNCVFAVKHTDVTQCQRMRVTV